MASLADLAATADELLALYRAQFQSANRLPALSYVSPGASPTLDGEALIVNLVSIRPGNAGGAGGAGEWFVPAAFVQVAEFCVTVCRECAVADSAGTGPPTTDAITADARSNITDMATMRAATIDIMADYSLNEPGVPWVLQGIDAFGPEGGLVGVRAILDLSVA